MVELETKKIEPAKKNRTLGVSDWQAFQFCKARFAARLPEREHIFDLHRLPPQFEDGAKFDAASSIAARGVVVYESSKPRLEKLSDRGYLFEIKFSGHIQDYASWSRWQTQHLDFLADPAGGGVRVFFLPDPVLPGDYLLAAKEIVEHVREEIAVPHNFVPLKCLTGSCLESVAKKAIKEALSKSSESLQVFSNLKLFDIFEEKWDDVRAYVQETVKKCLS